jgi:signal transduction histidine kinase
MAAAKPFEYSCGYRMPDGSHRSYHFRCLPVIQENGAIEFVRGVVHDITDQTRREEDLHRISQQLLRTQDVDRRNLARELHETAGQSLAALKMTLASFEEAIEESPQSIQELLKSARGLAEDAVREVRLVSHLMHPPELDAVGLGPALRSYVKGFSSRSGVIASLDAAENVGRQPQEVELTIFRIVQEALTNVHRYSGSSTASVSLTYNDEEIQIQICDDGCGLPSPTDPSDRRSNLGVGIAGMRERVKQLNGRFEMESTPGHGTVVRAALPILKRE